MQKAIMRQFLRIWGNLIAVRIWGRSAEHTDCVARLTLVIRQIRRQL